MATLVQFQTLVEMFDTLTQRLDGEVRPVLMHKVDGAYRSITYRELRMDVLRAAGGLTELGVQRGDRVALISENRTEWVIADLAMMCLGAINVSIYPTLTPKQIEYILLDAGCSYVIVSTAMQLRKVHSILPRVTSIRTIVLLSDKGVEEHPRVVPFARVQEMGECYERDHPDFFETAKVRVRVDDVITLIYTSGTTGNPKGVMLTHRNLASNIQSSAECIPFTDDDRVLSYLPLCHSYERMAGYYTALACGATIAFAESIETVRENLLEVKPTVVMSVPRILERIHKRIMRQVSEGPFIREKAFHWAIDAGKRHARAARNGRIGYGIEIRNRIADALVFRKIREQIGGRNRFIVSGGAALSRELGEFFEAVGIRIIEGYGMTESSPVIAVNRLNDQKFGTVGKPIPNIEVRIAPDGEILTRGPHVMKGYWKDEQATREAIDAEGWLHTGDIGLFDEDGFLVITDRKKHIFVSSGGKNIAPQHIESHFLESALIDEFILVGDGRMFLSAIIIPKFDALDMLAKELNIASGNIRELVADERIRSVFEREIAARQKDLASFERVRKFVLLDHPLSIEHGEITPTMKVKRKVVEEKYRDLIEKMYDGMG